MKRLVLDVVTCVYCGELRCDQFGNDRKEYQYERLKYLG